MGKGSGSAPQAPDPFETAAAEASINRVDTYSPSGAGIRYGTTVNGRFVPNGQVPISPVAPAPQAPQAPTTFGNSAPQQGSEGQGEPRGLATANAESGFVRPMQHTAPGGQAAVQYVESPTEQAIRERLEPASISLVDRMAIDNVENMPGPAQIRDRGDVASDIYNRSFSLLAPQIEQSNDRLLNNLQARGMPVGGEAFNEAYGEQVRNTNDMLSRLAMDADIQAGQEQSRLFGLESAQRGTAMAEIMALMGGNYNPPNPTPSGNTSPVNLGAMVQQNYSNELSAYNQQQQQRMQTMGAIGSLGAALIKSSAAFKNVLGQIDTFQAADVMAHIPICAWSYTDEHAPEGDGRAVHIGPMAEDFHAMTMLGRSDAINVIDYLGTLAAALQNALQRIELLEREAYGEWVN